MTAVVFAGPTLPPQLRPAGPLWDWRPPVRQGELYRAALARPAAMGVIDGYFEVVPTVWHKEILWAMAQGIAVFGAASIGALRAAELDVFGMRGVGRVYEEFRDGVLQDDDEVAVLHGPEELGYPPVTEAMVNLRTTLAEAARCSIIPPEMANRLIAIAKAMFYKERTWPALLAAAAAVVPPRLVAALAEWLPRARVDLKRLDAEAMLDAIETHLAAGAEPLRVAYEVADTSAWRAARRYAEATPDLKHDPA
ncbi:MAG: TfuA domain-containing protein [Alphaproteobacteria bacterium]|nr:TfuA domain-containing protein [Alphaproteobacteria bacterium]